MTATFVGINHTHFCSRLTKPGVGNIYRPPGADSNFSTLCDEPDGPEGLRYGTCRPERGSRSNLWKQNCYRPGTMHAGLNMGGQDLLIGSLLADDSKPEVKPIR